MTEALIPQITRDIGPHGVHATVVRRGGQWIATVRIERDGSDPIAYTATVDEGEVSSLTSDALRRLPPAAVAGFSFKKLARGIRRIARSKALRDAWRGARNAIRAVDKLGKNPLIAAAVTYAVPGGGAALQSIGQVNQATTMLDQLRAGNPRVRQNAQTILSAAQQGNPLAIQALTAVAQVSQVQASQAAQRAQGVAASPRR